MHCLSVARINRGSSTTSIYFIWYTNFIQRLWCLWSRCIWKKSVYLRANITPGNYIRKKLVFCIYDLPPCWLCCMLNPISHPFIVWCAQSRTDRWCWRTMLLTRLIKGHIKENLDVWGEISPNIWRNRLFQCKFHKKAPQRDPEMRNLS